MHRSNNPKVKYYAYKGKVEGVGTSGRVLFQSSMPLRRVLRKIKYWFGGDFTLFRYTNFYDDKTFTEITERS